MADVSPIDLVKDMSVEERTRLVHDCRDYSLCHGNLMKIYSDPVTQAHMAHTSSTTLVPSVYSREAYQKALSIQPLYNQLYHRVACDGKFLLKALDSMRSQDDFIRHHIEIFETLEKEHIHPRLSLGLLRSDYLCHHKAAVIKQVEFNTMSAAASGVCRAASTWHRYVTGTLLGLDSKRIPENKATYMLATAMVRTWELYGNPRAVIMFLVGPSEFNFADQRSLQYDIQSINNTIKVVRVTFAELEAKMRLDDSRHLYIDSDQVAIVYFRYGYAPKHYTSDLTWKIRLDLERSCAVKCPSIGYMLAGTKRVQQVLAEPGLLENWLSSADAHAIEETFVSLYSLEASEGGGNSVSRALASPEKFVLKPQRDGGGNNFYGEDLVTKLNSLDENGRCAYTLMEKIVPPTQENYLVAGMQEPQLFQVVSELGMFGAIVICDGKEVMNEAGGYLLRTKPADRSEGDLMRGTSSLDSPWLT